MAKHKGYNASGNKGSNKWFNPDNPQTGTGREYPEGVTEKKNIQVRNVDKDGKVIK